MVIDNLMTEEYKARIKKLVDDGHITEEESKILINTSYNLY